MKNRKVETEETIYLDQPAIAYTNELGQTALICEFYPHYDAKNKNIKAPAEAQTWEGRGYSGGHVSQSYWDTEQEDRKMCSLIKQGFFVQDTTERGQTGGYYPSVKFW